MGACCSVSNSDYLAIPPELSSLSKHQCRFEMKDSTSVEFWPSPHLNSLDENNTDILQHELFTGSTRLQHILTEIECNNLISCNDDDLMISQQESKINPFIECAATAFNQHLPLIISAQSIWVIILQAINLHINSSNSNSFLKKNVNNNTDNKICLTPLPSHDSHQRNNSYDYSTTGTKYAKEWIVKVKEYLGIIESDYIIDEECNDLLSSLKFSTTTYIDEVCCKLSVINNLNNTFNECDEEILDEVGIGGFISITLRGKKSDWLNLREKTINILSSKCSKIFNNEWSRSLLPVLDRFIAVYDGDIDCVYWNSMIKRGATHAAKSDRKCYSGWINNLFPLLPNSKKNLYCQPYEYNIEYINYNDKYDEIQSNLWPFGVSSSNATLQNNLNEDGPGPSDEHITIVVGFMGYNQNQLTYSLETKLGWIIASNTTNLQQQNDGHRLAGISEDDDDDDVDIEDDEAPLYNIRNSDDDIDGDKNHYHVLNVRTSDVDIDDEEIDDDVNEIDVEEHIIQQEIHSLR